MSDSSRNRDAGDSPSQRYNDPAKEFRISPIRAGDEGADAAGRRDRADIPERFDAGQGPSPDDLYQRVQRSELINKALQTLREAGYWAFPKSDIIDLYGTASIDLMVLESAKISPMEYIRNELIHQLAKELVKKSNIILWQQTENDFMRIVRARVQVLAWSVQN